MPEAAIDQHRYFRAREHEVDSDPFDSAMQAIAKALGVQCTAQTHLGKRILAFDATHDLGSRQRLSIDSP